MWIGYTPIAKDVYVGGYRWNVFQTASTNAVFVPTANQVDVDDAYLNLMDFIDEIVRRNSESRRPGTSRASSSGSRSTRAGGR